MSPSTKPRSSAYSRRASRAAECLSAAAECIGPVEPGLSLFVLMGGDFSLLDAALHVAREIGPCHLSAWAWVVGEYDVDTIADWHARGALLSASLLLDRCAEDADIRGVSPGDMWREAFGDASVRVCRVHSKAVRLWNDSFRVLLRGSANLNRNDRLENLDISEGGPEFDLFAAVESEIAPLAKGCTYRQARAVSRVDDSGGADMFGRLGAWSPARVAS